MSLADPLLMTIALSKGRIMKDTLKMMTNAGISVPADIEESRKLILDSADGKLRYILAKPADVPTLVEYGVADIGIVGKDVLLEADRDLYELLDLGIGRCRVCVCGTPEQRTEEIHRVASKYPKIASDYFRQQGRQVEVILLNGSVELAPLIGLADRIVDIVETGRTLEENGLEVHEEIVTVTTRMVANRMSYRLKSAQITQMVQQLKKYRGYLT